MPTILTPPEIERRNRPPHEGDNGSGRKPPTDKRTGGNGDGDGDGDNWERRPQGNRGPRERLSRARIGLFFALGGDLMFFVALVSVFFVTKSSGHYDPYNQWVHDWVPVTIPHILAFNTFVLLLSSITAEFARRGMFRERDVMEEWIGLGRPTSRRATLWLSITLALGAVFLAGQWSAWKQLAAARIYRVSQSSHFFYLITITHALHLALGILALLIALAVVRKSRALATRQVFVDGTVWYWHTMGVLWVFLYLLLEFGQ
jgi:cytochrome c oxidase subunit 3